MAPVVLVTQQWHLSSWHSTENPKVSSERCSSQTPSVGPPEGHPTAGPAETTDRTEPQSTANVLGRTQLVLHTADQNCQENPLLEHSSH